MAKGRGKESEHGTRAPEPGALKPMGEGGGPLPPIQELVRRAIAMGLSGFFMTEGTIRKALGDTLPKDWIDFAVEQSERTRQEFLERMTHELGRTLEGVDLSALLTELLEGRTLEVEAKIRLGAREDEAGGTKFRASTPGNRPK
jgi:hypothetical protein